MNISVIVIGRNSQLFLKQCLESIELAFASSESIINNFEIVYVDGNSTDKSVHIASKHNSVTIIEIISSTFFSASLGRYLGTKHAKYKNLLFMDSDMTLYQNWFHESLEYFDKYKAIIGQWTQINVANDRSVKEVIPNFNNINDSFITKKPCGFLQLSLDDLELAPIFHPLIVNNEEKDFYAQFYKSRKIFCVPVQGFKHYNLKQNMKAKLKSFFSTYGKTGYLVSAFFAIKKGYSLSYAIIQMYKILNIIFIVILLLLVFVNKSHFLWIAIPVILFPVSKIKSRIFDVLFFPYKLLSAIRLIKGKHNAEYIYKGVNYQIDLKF